MRYPDLKQKLDLGPVFIQDFGLEISAESCTLYCTFDWSLYLIFWFSHVRTGSSPYKLGSDVKADDMTHTPKGYKRFIIYIVRSFCGKQGRTLGWSEDGERAKKGKSRTQYCVS